MPQRGIGEAPRTVAEMLLDFIPRQRHRLAMLETNLVPHLRGNQPLYEALKALIESRIEARAKMPVPSTPLECQASMVRDKELRVILQHLERVYLAPMLQPADNDGEQPE